MTMYIKKQAQQDDRSGTTRARKLLQEFFPKSAWFGDVSTLRQLFATMNSRYKARCSKDLSALKMPKLDHYEVRRALLFLENLEITVMTDEDQPITLWELYEDSLSAVGRLSPKIGDIPVKNLAIFRYRVAQFAHIIRHARKATV